MSYLRGRIYVFGTDDPDGKSVVQIWVAGDTAGQRAAEDSVWGGDYLDSGESVSGVQLPSAHFDHMVFRRWQQMTPAERERAAQGEPEP